MRFSFSLNIAMAGASFLLLASPHALTQAPPTGTPPVRPASPAEATLEKRVDTYLDAYVKARLFSGEVLMARDGKPIYRKAFGFADWKKRVPNTPETRFKMASCTKSFTAVGICMLHDQGKLEFTDTLDKFFPDAPETWKPITVHQLLTHTSGLATFYEVFGPILYKSPVPTPAPTFADLFSTAFQQIRKAPDSARLSTKPGTGFEYSNLGYVLLGAIIEKVSGQRYQDWMQKNEFAPLGMTHSDFDTGRPRPGMARGYTETNDEIVLEENDMRPIAPAGGLVSTVDDLLLWNEALFGGKLLKPETLQTMLTPEKGGADYGYGWFIGNSDKRDGTRVVAHSGGTAGYISYVQRLPEKNLVILLLDNFALNGGESPGANDLTDLAVGKEVPAPRLARVPLTVRRTYVGQYKSPHGVDIISLENAQLRITLPDGRDFGMKALTPTRFWLGPQSEIEFTKDAQGRVNAMNTFESGMKWTSKRLPSPDFKAADYIGHYALSLDDQPTGEPFQILLRNKLLQATSGEKGEREILLPIAPDLFLAKSTSTRVQFQRIKGKVNGLKFAYGEHTISGRKTPH